MGCCSDVMEPIKASSCCTPKDTASHAARAMRDSGCGCSPVVEDKETLKLVGVVTERDVCCDVVANDRHGSGVRVEEIMRPASACCGADESIEGCPEQTPRASHDELACGRQGGGVLRHGGLAVWGSRSPPSNGTLGPVDHDVMNRRPRRRSELPVHELVLHCRSVFGRGASTTRRSAVLKTFPCHPRLLAASRRGRRPAGPSGNGKGGGGRPGGG